MALCIALQVPVLHAGTKDRLKENPYRPFTNIVYHSKNMRDFVEQLKPSITDEQYAFLAKKAEELPADVMPKARDLKKGVTEFHLQNVTVRFKTVSAEKEIFEINGKRLELASLSLDERLRLITDAVMDKKSAAAGLWDLLFPKAHADGGITLALAIIGTVLGVLSFCKAIYEGNSANCDGISKAAIECIDLTGKLQLKVKETASFFLTQKKLEEKGEEKSPELAKQTQDACKDLTGQVSQLEVIDFKGKNSMQAIALRCDYPKETLAKCQSGLRSTNDDLKGFVSKYCSPEATTTSPKVKNASVQTEPSGGVPAGDVPVIPDVLKKEPASVKPETTR